MVRRREENLAGIPHGLGLSLGLLWQYGKQVTTNEEDVGAELACESVRQNLEKVASDPAAYPGEAAEIVGYAGSADDRGLREAAEAFDQDPSVEKWDGFKKRCEELGLT
jgi:hypothetical protein